MQTPQDGTGHPAPADATAALGTRDRILATTARLLQHQGYEGTGIKQIAREAKATLGSVYHFFPGGKQELAMEALQHGDREFAELLRTVLATVEDPADAVLAAVDAFADALRASGWTDGCPVTTTALETTGTSPEIQEVCAAAFRSWQDAVHDKLRTAGIPEPDARELAVTVINTLGGAEITAQVFRDDAPLRIAGRHLARLIRTYR
ncbi:MULTISPECIES: TetR/AcrR family transcriptional regulator [Streptomyces]|uniref:TetR/AcrR family transcriptional regulator n=1 Tax=Streptomyces celluloflavus TaxID=58344 RepID=A0ABW7R876_9ACTN|nr:TetR/AcrR family transcriptional regulator [Streptomyces sp. SID7805]MYU57168.1 TetR family transcriptional regulator [Streptomyces sp. SID7805]WSK13215.1 TetR/AcrR family transcriptional regulator [Streptomyces celluloflavus]